MAVVPQDSRAGRVCVPGGWLAEAVVIAEEKITEIRERTDLVALVGEYVPLKRVGASFRGLCPFHSEKTPSFYVHPARQFFHCFGCQASGDALAFVMRLEGRTFPEAARALAERAGVELPTLDPHEEEEHQRARQHAERLVALMDAAAGFYVDQLGSHPLGAMAREELSRRGVGSGAAEAFRLGYAPDGWDGLVRFLRGGGWSPADAEEVGLIVPRRSGDGHYDRFRHRLMFPIADTHGRIVAFSGRLLDPPPGQEPPAAGEAGAKYVNSPEGPLYHKGEILFGLHEGRVSLRREGWALVCEGNFDLLSLHQAGLSNAVAPMGTALTESHARLLRRYASKLVLLFDGDRAGRKAVRAAWPLLAKVGLTARVVTLPPGADPDSFLREEGVEALRQRIDGAPSIVDHLIEEAALEAGGDPQGVAAAIEGLGPVLAALDNAVEVRLYVQRVAQKFGLRDEEAVRQQLRRGVRAARGGGRRHEPEPKKADPTRVPMSASAGESRPLPYLEAELIGAILDNPDLMGTEEAKSLEELLTSPDLRAIFQAASRMVESRRGVDASALISELTGDAAVRWLEERLAIQKYDERGALSVLRDGLSRLARQSIERELPRLQQEIIRARRLGDDRRADALTRERDELFTSANKLVQGGKR